MAIQIPNPGTGNGASGDNEFVLWSKVKDNFSNTTHAANRLVGTAAGNVMEVGAFGLGDAPIKTITDSTYFDDKTKTQKSGFGGFFDSNGHIFPDKGQNNTIMSAYSQDWATQIAFRPTLSNLAPKYRNFFGGTTWSQWATFWTTANTTIDVNQNIKSSSPVLQVFKDDVKKIHEANELPIKFTRNGVGDYTIEGTTGLRENDWQIVIPEDDHRNQLIAFTIEDDNGTIHLKTYKRTLSMETFLFGPDLKSPVDIPDGLWVDMHFNDLPIEAQEELPTDGG